MHFVAWADIEARIDQLRMRQIGFARYCRTQAEAVRQSAERSKSPHIRETMLALAQRYEQISDSVEEFIRRHPKLPAIGDHRAVDDRFPANSSIGAG